MTNSARSAGAHVTDGTYQDPAEDVWGAKDGMPVTPWLTIAMPAYNEAATIRTAVTEVLSAPYPCPVELVVVDDGSTDGTATALAGISDPRLRVISHAANQGKGAAIRTAIQAAGGAYLLPFDADLEYRAEDIAQVLAPVLGGVATVVYGPRLFGWHTVYQSFRYKMGNLVTTLAANILYDSALSDLHTCIKLVPLPLLREMALSETGFGLDTEITAKVLRSGHRPFEVPVHYYSRTHGQGKKINWRDGVRCLVVLARVRVSSAPPRVAHQFSRLPQPYVAGPAAAGTADSTLDLRETDYQKASLTQALAD